METQKQSWVVRYLRIDGEHHRFPCSFTCTVEASADGEGKFLAASAFNKFIVENKLNALFLTSEKL
jgi:hypothetical protein